MGKTLGLWLDRARAQLGDLGQQQRIDTSDLELGLQAALGELSKDRPREVAETFDGNGVLYDFILDPLVFIPDVSKTLEVEYPAGERVPVIVDSQSWTLLRGTTTIRLFDITPSVGVDNVKVVYTAAYPHPTDSAAVDVVPAAWFDAVAALAASEACRSIAAMLARRAHKQVAGVEIRDPATDDMFRLASELRNVYKRVVLGTESGSDPGYAPALSMSDTDVSHPHSLFHSGRR